MNQANINTELENRTAQLIIDTLNLEIEVSDIAPQDYLFGEGLALDSIDALELAMAITQQFGFQLRSDSSKNQEIFRSLTSLAQHIAENKTK
ncbi:phosphopantetheine-binding protein [sulfur-oxidizing endosymbiont of Gigantopelta aegis]|uniref:phosphopantetheine-binding protein n=1 Tax=sulfur-oxidizing endosymbiont of Gigantopelta aegis TaxID=2794934 RepID=UPI0018DD3A23|nr:phosphopantetheine-binding protein [sulfur-oxidizing endosymbiont of Gigantopelta aegis]